MEEDSDGGMCKNFDTNRTYLTLNLLAGKYKIPVPNRETKGELIIYYWPWVGKWEELRINIFYAIFKFYLMSCRTRKILPTAPHFENVLKIECKNIIMTTPTNKGLTDNLLPPVSYTHLTLPTICSV